MDSTYQNFRGFVYGTTASRFLTIDENSTKWTIVTHRPYLWSSYHDRRGSLREATGVRSIPGQPEQSTDTYSTNECCQEDKQDRDR